MATATKTKSTTKKSANGIASFKDDEIGTQIEALKADISRITERLSSIGEAGMQKAVYKGEKAKRDGIAATEEMLDELQLQLAKVERQLGNTVRRKPLQSLGIALGVGFLAALIARR